MHYPSPPSTRGDVATEASSPASAADELGAKLATLEREVRRDGWKTVTTTVTETEVISHDEASDVWFLHETPNSQAATVVEAFQDGGFISTCAYRQQRDGRLYELLLLLIPGSEHALLLPTIADTEQLPATPVGDDEMTLYSVITHATGERIGAVQHTTPSAMLPDAT